MSGECSSNNLDNNDMTTEQIKQKLSVIISSESTGNEKLENILELITFEHHLDMQYYMEYCFRNGYVSPMTWIRENKHF